MKVRQVRLRSPGRTVTHSFTELTCYVDGERVCEGDRITLKNSDPPEREWDVIWAGPLIELAEINRSWHVGGL